MNEYQRIVYKRTAQKHQNLFFIELDETLRILFMSPSLDRLGFDSAKINEDFLPFSSIIDEKSAEIAQKTLVWEEMNERNKTFNLTLRNGAGKKVVVCCAYRNLSGEQHNKVFDLCFFEKDDAGMLDSFAEFCEMQYDTMYKRAFDGLRIPIVETEDGQINYVNKAFASALGYKKSVLQSMKLAKLAEHSDREKIQKTDEILAQGGFGEPADISFATQEDKPFRTNLNSTLLSNGTVMSALHIALDTSAVEREHRVLKLFENALSCVEECVMITALHTKFVWLNNAFEREIGYTQQDLRETNDIFVDTHNGGFWDIINNKILPELKQSGCWIGVENITRADETVFPAQIKVVAVTSDLVTVVIRDMSHQLEVEKLLDACRVRDTLTGVGNIETFKLNAKREFERCKKENKRLSMIMFQISDFNMISRRYGFETANAVLKMIAQRAKGYIGNIDSIARLGECRFGMLYNSESNEKLIEFLEGFMTTMDWPMVYGNQDFFINVSVGVGNYPDNSMNDIELYAFAYDALKQARTIKRSAYAIFTRENGISITSHKNSLEIDLISAMSNNEFIVYYQPKVSIKENIVAAGEALVRWESPTYGTVPPNSFIHVAEDTGMILPLGYNIMETVCKNMKEWREKGLKVVPISINLTMNQLTDLNLADKVKEITEDYGIPMSLLEFEVSENNDACDYTYMFEAMKRLRKQGIVVSIDNFGTGTTSLPQLSDVPVSRLTVDRSLVKELEIDQNSRNKTTEAINHAKSIGLATIAEGVENEKQLEILRELGCDYYQGYYFSKPVANEEFETFLK